MSASLVDVTVPVQQEQQPVMAIPLVRGVSVARPKGLSPDAGGSTPVQADPLEVLASKIRKQIALVGKSVWTGLEHAKQAGELLALAKEQVKHGEWTSWLKNNCKLSPRTAQLYMRIAERWDEIEAKAQSVADLALNEAAKLVAKPKLVEAQPAASGSTGSAGGAGPQAQVADDLPVLEVPAHAEATEPTDVGGSGSHSLMASFSRPASVRSGIRRGSSAFVTT